MLLLMLAWMISTQPDRVQSTRTCFLVAWKWPMQVSRLVGSSKYSNIHEVSSDPSCSWPKMRHSFAFSAYEHITK